MLHSDWKQVAALRDPSATVRLRALRHLSTIDSEALAEPPDDSDDEDEAPLAKLVECIADFDPAVQSQALQILRNVDAEELAVFAPRILAHASHADHNVRHTAMLAAQLLGRHDGKAVVISATDLVSRAVNDPSAEVRLQAIEQLRTMPVDKYSHERTQACIAGLADADAAVRAAATRLVHGVAGPLLQRSAEIAERLEDASPAVRATAIEILVLLQAGSVAQYASAIVRHLADADDQVRNVAAAALTDALGSPRRATEVLSDHWPAILRASTDESPGVRQTAGRVLTAFDTAAAIKTLEGNETLDALVQQLAHPYEDVRGRALSVLSRLPEQELCLRGVAEAAARMLADEHNAKAAATTVLSKLPNRELARHAPTILSSLEAAPHPYHAMRLLASLDDVDLSRLAARLITALATRDASVRGSAVKLLARLAPTFLAPHAAALAEQLAAPETSTREAAAQVLLHWDQFALSTQLAPLALLALRKEVERIGAQPEKLVASFTAGLRNDLPVAPGQGSTSGDGSTVEPGMNESYLSTKKARALKARQVGGAYCAMKEAHALVTRAVQLRLSEKTTGQLQPPTHAQLGRSADVVDRDAISGPTIADGGRGAVDVSDAESVLSSANATVSRLSAVSVATSNVSLQSTVHSRQRLDEREILRRQLQEAVKHAGHTRVAQDRNGQRRYRLEHEGIVYITDASMSVAITAWAAPTAEDKARRKEERRIHNEVGSVMLRLISKVEKEVAKDEKPADSVGKSVAAELGASLDGSKIHRQLLDRLLQAGSKGLNTHKVMAGTGLPYACAKAAREHDLSSVSPALVIQHMGLIRRVGSLFYHQAHAVAEGTAAFELVDREDEARGEAARPRKGK